MTLRMRAIVTGVACLLALAARPSAQTGATLTILHFNDVYEITPVEAGRAGGLARVATLRSRLKARHPELLTMLAGDYLSPSALGTARVDGQRLAGRQMVAVLNTLGLDWATFGNHEFDVSEKDFHSRLAEAKFRIVSSNVTDASGTPFEHTVTSAIVPVKTSAGIVKVGLIGLTVDSNKQSWVRYAPPIDAARAAVATLKGKCDVILALTHLAIATDQELAEAVPDIDVILGGHEHENWFIERGSHFTPIIKADANVRSVAIVTIRLPKKGARPVVSARLERVTDRTPEDPRTAAEVKKWTDLGFSGFRADGFDPAQVVATIAEPLDGREASVRNKPTALTDLIANAMRREAKTDVAIFNGGSVRIDDVLPPGPVTQYDVIRVLPFGGRILKATFTGALLSRVLEAGEQNRGSGGFLQYAGITHDAGGFRVNGQPIDPAGHYQLAIADFLMTGGEVNLGFLTRQNPDVSGVSELRDVRMAVIDELRSRG